MSPPYSHEGREPAVSELHPQRVGLTTVGCKLNQYESEGLAELFESAGYSVVPFEDEADVYVVNTCTVTGRSDYRSRQMIRRAARRNPGALVVATGCYVQREPDELIRMPEVGLAVGQTAKRELIGLVELSRSGAGAAVGRVIVRPHGESAFQALDIERFRGYTRAFLKIQDGCDRRCAYCAVPDARGPSRSRPPEDVLAQAERLVANGYREIVLTGVHIGAYAPEGGSPDLHGLIERLASIDDLERIRLGSVEPGELTPQLAETVLSIDKVANHLHVPMESGSDRVLDAMGRGYTRDEYARAVRRVTDVDTRCGLGADVMVGFPGETDEDFADTIELIERLPFTYLHVFSFSSRKGTAAALMDDVVPGLEKRRRSRVLRELGRRKSLAFRRGLAGSTVDVLVEEGSGGDAGTLSGLAGNYVRLEFAGDDSLHNRFVTVCVEGADESRTWGTPVEGMHR